MMLQVQNKSNPMWKSCRASSAPCPQGEGFLAPYAQGMLKNKHIPFRKWESERFGIIDSVHKRCSSGWKGQVTMQFQYSGCLDCLLFLLFFPFALSMQTFIYESFGLKLLKFSHDGQVCCPSEGTCMYQGPCMFFFQWQKPNPLFQLVPERCMSANERCAWSVCSNALPFVQYLQKLN